MQYSYQDNEMDIQGTKQFHQDDVLIYGLLWSHLTNTFPVPASGRTLTCFYGVVFHASYKRIIRHVRTTALLSLLIITS